MGIELLRTAVLVLVRVEMILMLIRAVLSWFAGGGGRAYELVVMMTEPIVYPVRLLCDRLIPKTALPIDIPFIAAYLLLYVLELILSVL